MSRKPFNEEELRHQGGPKAVGRANAEEAVNQIEDFESVEDAFDAYMANVGDTLWEWGFGMDTDRGAKVQEEAYEAYVERFKELTSYREHNPGYGPARSGTIPTWVKPPKKAQEIAKRALRDREKLPKSKRGGLDAAEAKKQGITSGVLRAKSIARGDWQPAEDVNAFFQRFKNTHARALDKGKEWGDSKVQQAWDLWGGTPMWEAAKKVLREKNPSGTAASDLVMRLKF